MHAVRRAKDAQNRVEVSGLMVFFRDNGAAVLAAEIAGLAVCAAAMVMADRQSPRRADASRTGRNGTDDPDSENSDSAGRRDEANSHEAVPRQSAATDDKSRYD